MSKFRVFWPVNLVARSISGTLGGSTITVCFNDVPVGDPDLGVTLTLNGDIISGSGTITGKCIVYDISPYVLYSEDCIGWDYDSSTGNLAGERTPDSPMPDQSKATCLPAAPLDPFILPYVAFDGGDWFARGAQLDNPGGFTATEGYLAFSFKGTDVDTAMFGTDGPTLGRVQALFSGTGELQIITRLSNLLALVDFESASPLNDDEWHTVIASWDTSVANRLDVVIDGVIQAVTLPGAGVSDYAGCTNWVVGAFDSVGSNAFTGCLGPLVFHDKYVDLTDANNRAKVLTAVGPGNNMRDPGTGKNYIDENALISLRDIYDNYEFNSGTGGQFTLTGALSNCIDLPVAIDGWTGKQNCAAAFSLGFSEGFA